MYVCIIVKHDFQAAVVSILLYQCTTWIGDKVYRKKGRWELQKNVTSRIEQILEATSNETTVVQPATTLS